MRFFPRDQERVRNNRGKRAIGVRATEVLLYIHHTAAQRVHNVETMIDPTLIEPTLISGFLLLTEGTQGLKKAQRDSTLVELCADQRYVPARMLLLSLLVSQIYQFNSKQGKINKKENRWNSNKQKRKQMEQK